MNKVEGAKVVGIIGATYPNYNPNNLETAAEVWSAIFSDVDYKTVTAGLYSYIKNNHEFPPTPGQIYEIIRNAVNPDELNEEKAWDMVRKATENGLYGSEKEFDKLPEIIQKTIGSPHFIYSLAMLDAASLTVEKSHFIKAFRAELEKKKQIDNLPNGIKGTLEQMRKGQPAIENKQEVARLEMKEHYSSAYERTVAKYLQGADEEKEPVTDRQAGNQAMLRERFGIGETSYAGE